MTERAPATVRPAAEGGAVTQDSPSRFRACHMLGKVTSERRVGDARTAWNSWDVECCGR